MFKPISKVSFAAVLWVQVGLSLLGMAVAWRFLADDRRPRPVPLLDVQETRPLLRDLEPPGMHNGKDNAFF